MRNLLLNFSYAAYCYDFAPLTEVMVACFILTPVSI